MNACDEYNMSDTVVLHKLVTTQFLSQRSKPIQVNRATALWDATHHVARL